MAHRLLLKVAKEVVWTHLDHHEVRFGDIESFVKVLGRELVIKVGSEQDHVGLATEAVLPHPHVSHISLLARFEELKVSLASQFKVSFGLGFHELIRVDFFAHFYAFKAVELSELLF